MSKEDIVDIGSGKKYNIYMIIMNAYIDLMSLLYRSVITDDIDIISIIANAINEDKPLNIRTKKYDGLVLSSIKTDPIILEAVGKIIGVVLLTNQLLVEGCEYNKYIKR